MSCKLSLTFDNYKKLCEYINNTKNVTKEKKKEIKSNQINKAIEVNIIDALKSKVTDKRGLHQQRYHNLAKIYQCEHQDLSYREALQIFYKNNIHI